LSYCICRYSLLRTTTGISSAVHCVEAVPTIPILSMRSPDREVAVGDVTFASWRFATMVRRLAPLRTTDVLRPATWQEWADQPEIGRTAEWFWRRAV